MHHTDVRRSIVVLASAAMLASGWAAPAEARHGCYPGPCRDGDARLRGIQHSDVLFRNRNNPVTVKGANPGRGSVIRTTLRMPKRGSTQERLGGSMRVGPDRAYQALFVARPNRGNRVRLIACTRAVPRDEDNSNNCGSSRARIFN